MSGSLREAETLVLVSALFVITVSCVTCMWKAVVSQMKFRSHIHGNML